MAKIITENIVISLSRIVKSSTDTSESVISDELLSTIETVSQELLGDRCVVEISVVPSNE
jgi:hypothetical protein